MASTPEGRVKMGIKKVLLRRGIFFYMPVNNGMGQGGASDFLCVRPITITESMVGQTIGVFLAVEAKAPGKLDHVTARQAEFIKHIVDCGGEGLAVDNPADLDAYLESSSAEKGDTR